MPTAAASCVHQYHATIIRFPFKIVWPAINEEQVGLLPKRFIVGSSSHGWALSLPCKSEAEQDKPRQSSGREGAPFKG